MEYRHTEQLREELTAGAREIGVRPRPLGLAMKRCCDFVAAMLGLIIAGPLMLILAWLIRRGSPGPAIFSQQRLGQWGRPFTLYKLRTMVEGAEKKGAGLAIEKEDPRITPIGKILRATSMDELPQLWNVLKGDMSFVGPRPLPVTYLERWDRRQRLRLLMPQGITGWSQVVMRVDGPWPERLERDVEYVRDWSLWFDVKMCVVTVAKVLSRRGVSTSEGTVEEFKPGAVSKDENSAESAEYSHRGQA